MEKTRRFHVLHRVDNKCPQFNRVPVSKRVCQCGLAGTWHFDPSSIGPVHSFLCDGCAKEKLIILALTDKLDSY